MLDKKFGLKFSMPHSVVHIVDNSMYTGELPVTVADDPSLYASIVITGAPMGEDNRVITINRSDVASIAYGLGNISSGDIKKYGQAVTYPTSILGQGVPIKFMRVTPPDSTYAFSCLLVQWRWDPVESMMHVRFKTTSGDTNNGLPAGKVHSSYKNPSRLNDALVRGFYKNNVTEEGVTWKQRVFMTTIAAGRGKEYNFYNYAINQTQQSKRPANVRYLFSTIDTRTDLTTESFFASLINQNNGSRLDAIDTVNVLVNRRVKGSSILIPTINESAVTELYNDYMYMFKECMDNFALTDTSDSIKFYQDVYATMSINIFDPLYGRYIYNGDSDVKLPYYQVDMFDLDIPQLNADNRIIVTIDTKNDTESVESYVANPKALYNLLDANTYGIGNPGDTYHVGDVFTTNSANPIMSLVTSVNQYTGSITTIPISEFITDTEIPEDREEATTDMFAGSVIINEEENGTEDEAKQKVAKAVNELIYRRKLIPRKTEGYLAIKNPKYKTDAVVVIVDTVQPNLFTVALVNYKEEDPKASVPKVVCDTDQMTIFTDPIDVYKRLVYPTGTVASFAVNEDDPSWKTPGSTIIDISKTSSDESIVSVNGYSMGNNDTIDRKNVATHRKFIVGTPQTSFAVTKDIVNQSYDVMIYDKEDIKTWTLMKAAPDNGGTGYTKGYTFTVEELDGTVFRVASVNTKGAVTSIEVVSSSETKSIEAKSYNTITSVGDNEDSNGGSGLTVKVELSDIKANVNPLKDPIYIQRYIVSGTQGSIYRVSKDQTFVPANYYSSSYGINPNSEMGGIPVEHGYAGFFDDDISEIEFKWRYSELLVQAFRGKIDPSIMSPTRVPAKYLFDAGYNTIIGQTILPYMTYTPIDIINASTIYTEDEKEMILLDNTLISDIKEFADIDVKQAMYDLMEYRVYQGIPEAMRPIGPGSGLSLHLDGGITDATTAMLINQSFNKRFTNPNASWDIGGYVSSKDGISYTYTKRIVENMFAHLKRFNVNKPFTGKYTSIGPDEYVSFFPDIDTTDWEMRELLYNSGGNAWIMDINGNIQRKSQRTLYKVDDTSDIIQESNMRTLSQAIYLLQNKIDSYLLEYNEDGVLKTLKDECDNMFTNWKGSIVQSIDINFKRDINPEDGGEIVVCYFEVVFRGLILRVPIIVNIQRRNNSGE